MPIDTSIYQNVRPPQIDIPNPMDAATKALSLSQLGLQNQQMQNQMATTQAVRSLYGKHTGPDGKLDQQGFLSDLAKVNPQASLSYQEQFGKADKGTADAQAAKADALGKMYNFTGPAFDYLNTVPDAQRPAAYAKVIRQLKDQGVDVSAMDHPYDADSFRQYHDTWRANKASLENQLTQANIAKTQADTKKTQSETIEKIPEALAGGDPAKLIGGRVPKDLQAKAFEEVKSAKEINGLAPKIEAAFQQASSRNPNTSANGKKELAALLYTTVKETEGTSRKQAFDAIDSKMVPSGLLSRPGENEAKLRTIGEYLQSKNSYPITGGHGIDLSKFTSTRPYQMGSGAAKEQGGGLLESTANAAEPQGTSGQSKPQATAHDQAAIEWLKTADKASPDAFSVRAKLKKKGLL